MKLLFEIHDHDDSPICLIKLYRLFYPFHFIYLIEWGVSQVNYRRADNSLQIVVFSYPLFPNISDS